MKSSQIYNFHFKQISKDFVAKNRVTLSRRVQMVSEGEKVFVFSFMFLVEKKYQPQSLSELTNPFHITTRRHGDALENF